MVLNDTLSGLCVHPHVAHDCFELGRLAYNKGDWYHAVKWMQQAIIELDGETTPGIDRALTLDYLSYATYMVSMNRLPPPTSRTWWAWTDYLSYVMYMVSSELRLFTPNIGDFCEIHEDTHCLTVKTIDKDVVIKCFDLKLNFGIYVEIPAAMYKYMYRRNLLSTEHVRFESLSFDYR